MMRADMEQMFLLSETLPILVLVGGDSASCDRRRRWNRAPGVLDACAAAYGHAICRAFCP